MCENCSELRAKCLIISTLAKISIRADLEARIERINDSLDLMGFTTAEKKGLKYSLNNSKF